MDLSKASYDQLKKELQRRESCLKMPKKNLILLGPPGSGKGTQAGFLLNDFCYCQISTGDLLREAVAKKTPAGVKAKEAMDKGQLVTDQIVNEILTDAIRSPACERGVIFDGYPRNQEQAENLEKLLSSEGRKLDSVIELKINEDLLVERIEGRRIHPQSGRSYHIKFNPPKVEGKDDVTGEPLIHRDDDKREVLKSRLEIYNQKTKPISQYYSKKGLLKSLDAMKKLENVKSDVRSLLI
jgi:adenylate kinase